MLATLLLLFRNIGTYGSTVKVLGNTKDPSLLLRNTLDLVRPLAGNLDGSLNGFSSSAHGQNHVVAENAADLLSPLGEDIVVEGPGAEGQSTSLLGKSLDEFGVAVALVDGAVGREEVVVVAALRVPDVDALSAGEDYGERVVVVSCVLLLNGDGLLGRGCMEPRDGLFSVGRHCDWDVTSIGIVVVVGKVE